jgi:hypothetical protein
MGRQSVLEARTEKRDGVVANVWIGGAGAPVIAQEIDEHKTAGHSYLFLGI